MPWFANIWVCCTVQRLGIAIICALVSRRKPSQTKGMVSILFLCAFGGKNRRLKDSFLGVSWMAVSTQKVHHSNKKKCFFQREATVAISPAHQTRLSSSGVRTTTTFLVELRTTSNKMSRFSSWSQSKKTRTLLLCLTASNLANLGNLEGSDS